MKNIYNEYCNDIEIITPTMSSNGENDVQYTKLSDRDHILSRSDMYCGSVISCKQLYPVMGDDGGVESREIQVAPALLNILQEPIANASDRVSARYQENSSINNKTTKIMIEMDNNSFSITNDGDGISSEFLGEHQVHVPEFIFANLRTSSNYDDNEKRYSTGRNGLGCKIVNIFSKEFTIETIDCKNSKKYQQRFSENMSVIGKPKITKFGGKPYTKVTFVLDGGRFGCKDGVNFSNDVIDLMRLRIHELAMCSLDKIKVTFNGKSIKTESPDKYLELYGVNKSNMIQEIDGMWKVAVAFTPENGGFRHHSFVNSTPTAQGGTHLNHVVDPLIKTLVDQIKKKFKLTKLRPSLVKDSLTVVVCCHVVNPTFSSQTKDCLTLPSKDFGSSFEIPEKFFNKIMKMGIVDHIGDLLKNKESSVMKDSDGKKASIVKGIPKLSDAKFAGTKKSGDCFLIVTEGDSALTMALSATSVIGRDKFGAFPLRGKLLNVRDSSPSTIAGNEEISNLKKILGLQSGAHYSDTSRLRYGGIILLTDSDVDGIHIRGLLLNLFEVLWPSLLNMGYVHTLNTPIVRATRGSNVKLFYNDHEYKEWMSLGDSYKSYKIKYLKGLGSSTPMEAREYFKDVYNDIVKYTNDIQTKEAMSLAFDKKRANDRKKWLMEYDEDGVIDTKKRKVTVSEFVHKELIHFSTSDMKRSIPSVIDGFKTTQRKALCGGFMKGIINTESKVAQLGGFISDKLQYHHGETSMCSTIIGMAQDFVGSNNIEIFTPKGQFGSRLEGGKDAASPRYVFVQMNPSTSKIFNRLDDPVLSHLEEDGSQIEPEYYVPILPMILVNGASGIATGYSCQVPQFNPLDIVSNIKRRLRGEPPVELVPYYRGFTGKIVKSSDDTYTTNGVYKISSNTVKISELPIGTWSTPYKIYLSGLVDKKLILGFEEKCTDSKVDFEVKLKDPNDLKLLKLTSTIRTSNMHLFDSNNRIKKYESVSDIEEDHFKHRLSLYHKRKEYQLNLMRYDHLILTEKCRFFDMKISGEIILENKSYDSVISEIVSNNFIELSREYGSIDKSFGYITDLKLFDVTKEKVVKLNGEAEKLGRSISNLEKMDVRDIWVSELDGMF